MLKLNGEAVPKVYQEPILLSSLDSTPQMYPSLKVCGVAKRASYVTRANKNPAMQFLLLSLVGLDHVHFS